MINFRRLKDIREDNDINQKEMAEILNVKRSAYSLWELSINIIPLKSLCDFADYFNLSIDYVLDLTNNKNVKITNKGLNLKILGNNIKKIRIKNDLSQDDLANILGVSQPCIAKYENGQICISIDNLYKFCKNFNISFSIVCGKSKK